MGVDTLEELNEKQKEAVTNVRGPLLVLAGAGSGKTKTITTRLAYLIMQVGVPPENTLTLTFTNKAAREMQERAFNLLKRSGFVVSNMPLLTTFHRFGLIFLKQYSHLLGISPNFVVVDSDDRHKLIKQISKNNAKMISALVSHFKNMAIRADNITEITKHMGNSMLSSKEVAHVYQEYEKMMRLNGGVDFDDLLLMPYTILNEHKEIRQRMSDRYNFIMVDEYQDTNVLQDTIIRLLCENHSNICVVGDDDQSIYSWRGADVGNIINFPRNFPDTLTIRLETNYRSTQDILNAANNLISFNERRIGKTLKSARGSGKGVRVINAKDDSEEIRLIVEALQDLRRRGESYDDMAILFRLNSLSRFIEHGLNKYDVPFKLIGVMRFYDRMEIKDILAYLKLVVNIDDNLSFMRVINVPRRGIGQSSVDKMMSMSRECSVYQNYKKCVFNGEKYYEKLKGFFDLIEKLKVVSEKNPIEFIQAFKSEVDIHAEDAERKRNMDEFYGYFHNFFRDANGTLQDLLNEIGLDSSVDQVSDDSVSCMSIHSSKGLEFKHVFVVGMEEGFLPFLGEDNIQEERRIGYVAFTRARDTLTLSYVEQRNYRGRRSFVSPSRFLTEMNMFDSRPRNVRCEERGMKGRGMTGFRLRECVKHEVFGIGIVEKVGVDGRVFVNFGGDRRYLLNSSLKSLE